MQIRPCNAEDLPFLEEMLIEAFFCDPVEPRLPLKILRGYSEFMKLLAGWGRAGDRAVIAEEQGSRLGAAWFRLWTPELHSYGFVEAGIPELGIAVARGRRSQGLGRSLLRALIETAHADGFAGLSLSVSPSNFARHLYESEGFQKVGESGTSWTLLLEFSSTAPGACCPTSR